jgi:hypothetical protein
MNIVNKTRVNAKQLGALIRAVAVEELWTPDDIEQLRIRVVYRRRTYGRPDNHPGGYAYYDSYRMCLKFVRGVQPDPVGTAKTIAHELAHCKNVQHRNMNNNRYGWKPGWRETWAWVVKYPLEMLPDRETVKPSKSEKASKDIERCQKALEDWQRKAKLAATKLRKWKRKLDYYEKKLAAMPAEKKAELVPEPVKTETTNGQG